MHQNSSLVGASAYSAPSDSLTGFKEAFFYGEVRGLLWSRSWRSDARDQCSGRATCSADQSSSVDEL